MKRYEMPVSFEDGKLFYDAVLAVINRTAPAFARLIHENERYNPLSLQLPNIVNVLDPAAEMLAASWGLKEVKSLTFQECFHGPGSAMIRIGFKDTHFRKGGISNPLPDPWLMVQNWKDRWNSMSPEKISIDLPIPGKRNKNELEIKWAHIHVEEMQIYDYRPMPSFSGSIRMLWMGNDEDLRKVWALLRFAEFAGTGAKTTMGCGVTRIEGRREGNVSAAQHAASV